MGEEVGEEVGDTMAVEQLKPLKEEVHRQLYPPTRLVQIPPFSHNPAVSSQYRISFERKKNKKGGE